MAVRKIFVLFHGKEVIRLILIAVVALTLSACDGSYQDGYDTGYNDGREEGYSAGLEEQRAHICNKIHYADDHAFEILKNERICQ